MNYKVQCKECKQVFVSDCPSVEHCGLCRPDNQEYISPPFPLPSSWNAQEGGDHYKKLPIQPMAYSMENKLDALQHTIIKYVTRFRDKGGIADLHKAKHCIDMLIEWESDHPSK